MAANDVTRAYSERAAEYVRILGRIEHALEEDRGTIEAWAGNINGLILDVGCGPGQWTNFLREHGANVEGVDPVPAFVEAAQSEYPASSYRLASAEKLGVADCSLAGILAWYSLIHTAPEHIDECLAEFARTLSPGGSLLIGYFDGVAGEAFDHAVVTAYYWSASVLSAKLNSAGFAVTEVVQRNDPGARPHGALIAQKAN